MRRSGTRRGVSKSLQELGRQMAKEQGIEPLKPGEGRPVGYYTVNSFTGKSGFKPGAVVRKGS